MQQHKIDQLRSRCMEDSTTPFKSRGSKVQRCQQCMQAHFACLCPWRISLSTHVEIVLIIHRNELYKPTNSGRLLAELFPMQTHVYLWSRTDVEEDLHNRLQDSSRENLLLFPSDSTDHNDYPSTTSTNDNNAYRLIILDGTWKQAARMARLSPWLDGIRRFSIGDGQQSKSHYSRQALNTHQLSTAESATIALRLLGASHSAEVLQHYFSIFNEHCLASRRNITPKLSASHHFLTALKQGTN